MGWARLSALLLLLTALAHPGDGLCFEWIWEKGYGTEAGNLLIYTDPLILTTFVAASTAGFGVESPTIFPYAGKKAPMWWDGDSVWVMVRLFAVH